MALDRGALLIAGACLAWGVDNNLTRKLSSADPVVIAAIKGLVGWFGQCRRGAFAPAPIRPSPPRPARRRCSACSAIGVSLVLFILALRHLGTARTGAYFSLAPFIGAAASFVAAA